MMPKRFTALLCLFLLFCAAALFRPKAMEGQQMNCLDCHGELAPKGHTPAVAMGCTRATQGSMPRMCRIKDEQHCQGFSGAA
jgi:hypothetical protein